MHEHLYNFHDILLIMTAAFSWLLAVPMLMQRSKLPQDEVLAVFVSVQGLLALYYLLLYSAFYRPVTVSLFMPFQALPIALLFGVQGLLLLWFSRLMAGKPMALQRGQVIAVVIVLLIPFLQRINVPTGPDLGPKSDGIFQTFPALVVSIYFGFQAIATVWRHEQEIRERYSNLEHVNLVWLGYIALGFVGVWMIRLAHYFLGIWGFYDLEQTMAVASNFPPLVLMAAMVILSLSQRRVTQVASHPSSNLAADNVEPATQSACARAVDPELVSRLENLMTTVRVYEDPDLDREGLADSLGISSRALSACINGHYGANFYEFVNSYRIAAVKMALQDPEREDQSIQRLFEEAGFNSKSTFNTLFKRDTGMTPSEYRRQAASVVPVSEV